MSFYEINCLLGITPRHRSLINGQLDNFLILNQGSLPFGQGRFRIIPEIIHPLPTALRFPLVVGMVHVIRVWNTKISVETI